MVRNAHAYKGERVQRCLDSRGDGFYGVGASDRVDDGRLALQIERSALRVAGSPDPPQMGEGWELKDWEGTLFGPG